QVWEMQTRTRHWVGRTHLTKIRCVMWSPDSTRLASGGDDGSVCLWGAEDGVLLERWQGHQGVVASVAWSLDGKWLASGGGGRGGEELFVWDVQRGEVVQRMSGHTGCLFAVAWS